MSDRYDTSSKPHDLKSGGKVGDRKARKHLPQAWKEAQESGEPITGRSLVKRSRELARGGTHRTPHHAGTTGRTKQGPHRAGKTKRKY